MHAFLLVFTHTYMYVYTSKYRISLSSSRLLHHDWSKQNFFLVLMAAPCCPVQCWVICCIICYFIFNRRKDHAGEMEKRQKLRQHHIQSEASYFMLAHFYHSRGLGCVHILKYRWLIGDLIVFI